MYSGLKGRNICQRCYRLEQSIPCSRCKRSFRPHPAMARICTSCARISVRLESPLSLVCVACKRLRIPHEIGSRYCEPCWARRQRSYGHCRRCGRNKQIRLKTGLLCASCYHDELAAGALRRYVSGYTCRFVFNRTHFTRLTARIDWTQVRERQNRRFRYIGKFLQEHELASPRSWDQLVSLMPPLGTSNRNIPKQIRMSLLDIGHIAAERGEIEPYAQYLERRAWHTPIARAPQEIQPLLVSFADWLNARQTKCSALEHRLRVLAKFWQWSFARSITRPMEVSRELIGAYLQGLYWQWRCEHCAKRTYCDGEFDKVPQRCTHCQRARALRRVPYYRQNTVRQHGATLSTFFDWAKLARRAMTNPVVSKIAAPDPKIQHHPPEVLQQIGRFIAADDADPIAAVMLYLIVFHLATVQELRYLRLPTVISLATRQNTFHLSTETSLALPKRQASLGIMHPGRPGDVIRFHRSAQPWLARLLGRFEHERTAIIGPHGKARYVFASRRGALRDTPVCPVWIWQRIRESTLSITGVACNANTLRKTAAIYIADRVGAGVLSSMGFEAQQAFAYSWVTREVLTPDA
jgi:hypothetical protein